MKKNTYFRKRSHYYRQENIRPHRMRNYNKKQRILFVCCLVAVAFLVGVASKYLRNQQSDSEVLEAEVIRVIDGDTIAVYVKGQEERIRMIGIDAPESVSGNEDENTIYGEKASQYTEEHLPQGMKIYLTFDKEREDKYERMLAYVWLSNDVSNTNNLYQKQMVEDGYALAYAYEPNTMYKNIINFAMQSAVSKRVGLWSDEIFYNENYYFIME